MLRYHPTMGPFLVAAFSVFAGSGAQGGFSANELMPARPIVTNSEQDPWKKPFCAGLMSGLAYMNDESCRPPGVTQGQIGAVVVQYIDARPANEDFKELALEAMKAAWPCKK